MAISLDALLGSMMHLGSVKGDMEVGKEYREIVQDGVYSTYSTGMMSVCKKIANLGDGVIIGPYPKTKEEYFEVHNKVPFDIFMRILKFFKDICDKTTDEASVLVYGNPNGLEIPQELKYRLGEALIEQDEFVILVPTQVNTKTHSSFVSRGDYKIEGTDIEWCHKNLVGVLEAHSHNTMGTMWSGEDDLHERSHTKLKMFLVIGTLDKKPSYRLRYVYNREFVDHLDLGVLFDIPKIEEKTVYKRTVMLGDTILSEVDEVDTYELTVDDILGDKDFINKFEYPVDAWNKQVVDNRPKYTSPTVNNSTGSGFVGKYTGNAWGRYYGTNKPLKDSYVGVSDSVVDDVPDDSIDSDDLVVDTLVYKSGMPLNDTKKDTQTDLDDELYSNFYGGSVKGNKNKHFPHKKNKKFNKFRK